MVVRGKPTKIGGAYFKEPPTFFYHKWFLIFVGIYHKPKTSGSNF